MLCGNRRFRWTYSIDLNPKNTQCGHNNLAMSDTVPSLPFPWLGIAARWVLCFDVMARGRGKGNEDISRMGRLLGV